MIAEKTKEWWQEITDDLPFNMHVVHRPEDASFVVGEEAERYVERFRELYARATGNCIVTTIAGFPGSGKSYMLAHLTYMMMELKDPPGIPILLRLIGQEYHPTDFVRAIRSSAEYQTFADAAGVQLDVVSDEASLGSLKRELDEIRNRKPQTVLCLFVDNVDEYLRLVGGQCEGEQGITREKAWADAMLTLLRALNAINDAIGSGVCSVLSLTRDVVQTLHLEDTREKGNLITGLVGQDSTLRRRFFPVHESASSSRLHIFGAMELPDAAKMVAHNLEIWFRRHPAIVRETRPDCQFDGLNLYPFQAATVERIHMASEFPGEVILGCLSTLNRYRDLRTILASSNAVNQSALAPTISESIAASGILQMSQYFRKIVSGEVSENDLRDLVLEDPIVQYAYVLPQEVTSVQLAQGDVLLGLGPAFVGFLRRLTSFKVRPVSTDPVFIKTKGRMRFPEFPTFDCMFQHNDKLFGVQFLSEASADLVEGKVETCCRAVRAETPGTNELFDHVHSALLVCVCDSGGSGDLSSGVAQLVSCGCPSWSFVNQQGRDYRPKAAIAVVPEEVAWSWKVLGLETMLRDRDKDFLAILMENVEVHYWEDDGQKIVERQKLMRWPDFLTLLAGLTDTPSGTDRSPPPDRGGWER